MALPHASKLAVFSIARIGFCGVTSEDKHTPAIPMRAHMLRNAIFWAVERAFGGMQIRLAGVVWNQRQATCVLVSGMFAKTGMGRLWEEEEYCMDNWSGLLLVHSFAPGVYVMYHYDESRFHDRYEPNRITICNAGEIVLDAQVSMTDPGLADPNALRPTPEMLANGPVTPTELPVHFRLNFPGTTGSTTARPVVVHASVDGTGSVVEEEVSSSADRSLTQSALDLVKNFRFPATGTQRQVYVNARLVPPGQ